MSPVQSVTYVSGRSYCRGRSTVHSAAPPAAWRSLPRWRRKRSAGSNCREVGGASSVTDQIRQIVVSERIHFFKLGRGGVLAPVDTAAADEEMAPAAHLSPDRREDCRPAGHALQRPSRPPVPHKAEMDRLAAAAGAEHETEGRALRVPGNVEATRPQRLRAFGCFDDPDRPPKPFPQFKFRPSRPLPPCPGLYRPDHAARSIRGDISKGELSPRPTKAASSASAGPSGRRAILPWVKRSF